MGKKVTFIKRHRILILAMCLIIGYFGISLVNQELKIKELKSEKALLEEKQEALNKKIQMVDKEIEKSDNLDYIGKEAREKLKMVKDNEIIYIIQDSNVTN